MRITARSKVLYTTPDSMQAPNWTRDGKALTYDGGRQAVNASTSRPIRRPSSTPARRTANNNDHVLSFDGTMLGISHRPSASQNSVVYTVPTAGGAPPHGSRRTHRRTSSWSPDAQVAVSSRAGATASSTCTRFPPRAATRSAHRRQGRGRSAESTPDGRSIFFNSSRTGRMQIWKMRPDGTDQQQITGDEFDNWFPHIAPDGKSMVVLSFLADIDPGDNRSTGRSTSGTWISRGRARA